MKLRALLSIVLIIIGTILMFSYFVYETVDRQYLIKSHEYGGEGLPFGSQFYSFSLKRGDIIEFGSLVGPPIDIVLKVKVPPQPGVEWETEIIAEEPTDGDRQTGIVVEHFPFEFVAPNDGIYELFISNNLEGTQDKFYVLLIRFQKNLILLYVGGFLLIVGSIIAVSEFLGTDYRIQKKMRIETEVG